MKKLIAGLGLSALPMLAFAQAQPPVIGAFSSIGGFQAFICTVVVGWMFTFLIVLAVVFVLIAAYQYLTSSGDAEKVASAGHMIMYAAIAVAVALLARAIPLLVDTFIGGGGATNGIC